MAKIVSVKITDTQIEVVYQQASGACYMDGNPVPDKVWKQVYSVDLHTQ
jgi:hypothetical protein